MASSTISALIPVAALLLMMIAGAARVAEAQQVPSCAMKLVPCAAYLNATTKPPSSCCDPLKEAVTKELSCLCSLYENPELVSLYGINVTQALKLPVSCGISGNLDACNITKAAGPSGSASNPPPATPGGGNNGSNGADRMVGAGFSSLLLLVASMVLY